MTAAMKKKTSNIPNVSFMTVPANESNSVWMMWAKEEPGEKGDFAERGCECILWVKRKSLMQMGLAQVITRRFGLVFQFENFEVR